MWNCVEDRMENEDRMYSRVIRKLIFEDLYADRSAVLSRRPIAKDTLPQLKPGDRVAFYDNCEIREGNFLCSSEKDPLDAKQLLSEVLSTEEELRNFCKSNNLASHKAHLFTMVIEAYLFLKKHSTEAQKSQNSVSHDPNVPSQISISIQNRKRTIPPEAEEPKIKVMKSLQSENVLETGLQGIPIQIQKASPKKIAIAPTPLQLLPNSSRKDSKADDKTKESKNNSVQEIPEFFVSEIDDLSDAHDDDAVKQEIADQTVEVIDFSTEDENTEIIEQNLSGTDVMRMDSNHMQPQTSAAMLNFGAMGIPYVPIPRPIRTDNGQLVVQIVKAENLELVRIEKGNRNSIIFHVIHKPSRKFGQFVLYGYVKNLDHVKLQCRWRYPDKGEKREVLCPAFITVSLKRALLCEPHQRTAKNFITGRRMDIHGLAVQKKINPSDMESFNPANYEILYGCVQHMCDCFADYSPDPENSAECQKIEEFEET